jgi:thioredoxin-dependent peroxiredoxin
MANITLKGNPVTTIGELPSIGSTAPDFTLVKTDLSEATLSDFKGKNVVVSITPSLDTGICAIAIKQFNKAAAGLTDTVVLTISADLPFAHKRFCETEGIENVITLSNYRSPEFGKDYGVLITSGPMKGLLSRSIVILDKTGKVIYTEQVSETAQEPNYDAALSALKS